ncbi:MAG: DUF4331 domain-containing protein, partial [Sphingomicrobium sp.]
DNTDVYAFRSYEPGREGFVTFISNFQPAHEPGGGPNYSPLDDDAIYEIHIDNNGDAVEDVTYQFKFNNTLRGGNKGLVYNIGGKNVSLALRHDGVIDTAGQDRLAEFEQYSLSQVLGPRRTGVRTLATDAVRGGATFFKPFDNAGNKSIPNYPQHSDAYIFQANLANCGTPARVFVGQREEQFAVNLGPIFDTVNLVPIQGAADPVYSSPAFGPFPGGITQSDANQELINNYNVTTIAIEVPIACVKGTGNGVIGVWSSASMPQSRLLKENPTYNEPDTQGGAFVQVSRLGSQLVTEVVIGLPDKDLFNAARPTQDGALADYVTNPTYPEYLNRLFRGAVNATLGTNFATLAPTNFPRNDLVAAFLTGIATLNQMSTVTASEMLRLNTAVNPTPLASQKALGVVADDLAGFPNGRRPGDDVVDIVLRVAMGRLCHPIPINGVQTQLGLCQPSDAPTGLVAYTDGAPSNANYVMNRFPYLNPALRGAPRPQDRP